VACPEHAALFKHERAAQPPPRAGADAWCAAATAAERAPGLLEAGGRAGRQAGATLAAPCTGLTCPPHPHAPPRRPPCGHDQGGPSPPAPHALWPPSPPAFLAAPRPPPGAAAAAKRRSGYGGAPRRGKRRRVDVFEIADHVARAKAARGQLRAELEAARAASSDDEQAFAKKEARRLEKDLARMAPVLLAPPPAAAAARGPAGAGTAPPPQAPQQQQQPPPRPAALETVSTVESDATLAGPRDAPGGGDAPAPQWVAASEGFASIGGLEDIKRSLREMVLLPLSQPGLLRDMGIAPPRWVDPLGGRGRRQRAGAGLCAHAALAAQAHAAPALNPPPPSLPAARAPGRGILLHGVPGTGKTALVRALAGECARRAARPVALFARKGADCLGKYAGDAERALRLLFQQVAGACADGADGQCWGRALATAADR
jgi:hypothetical protein